MHILSGRRCGHVSTPRSSREQSCAGGMDTSDITDIIKFYLFQVWGHRGCCNHTVCHLELFFHSKHLVVSWMHVYQTWISWGDHTPDPGCVRVLNDKLIYTGRGRNDRTDNTTLYKENLFWLRSEIRLRQRWAHLELKPSFSLCYPNAVGGQNNKNTCYSIATGMRCWFNWTWSFCCCRCDRIKGCLRYFVQLVSLWQI